jgi:hypothetical protein
LYQFADHFFNINNKYGKVNVTKWKIPFVDISEILQLFLENFQYSSDILLIFFDSF